MDDRTISILRGISRFCSNNGIDSHSLPLIAPEILEAYLVQGLSHRTSSTKGTYRSVITNILGIDALDGLSFRGSIAKEPYSIGEIAGLISNARSQNKAWRRSSGLAMIALSIGGGCRAQELRNLKGGDLTTAGNLTIGDRTVPLRPPWNQILGSIGRKDDQFFFHPGAVRRNYKNFINDFAYDLNQDPGSVRFQMSRARSSFIRDRWNEAMPLADLLEMAGIREVESLMRYVDHLDGAPKTKAGLRWLVANGIR